MRAIRYAYVLGGAAALLSALSGCVSPPLCAGAEVVTEVGVYFAQDGYTDLVGATWQLCTHSVCAKAEVRQESITRARIQLPTDVTPDAAPVRFRVTRRGATIPFIDDTAKVRLLHQSDGCGGGGYSRDLAYTKETGLTADIPKKVSDAWLHQLRSDTTAPPTPSESP
ncbi:hypothetical protein [Streptomyces sp. NPDC047000]|uniref:hypothetical protein n=1 Tax=Streptomyces sp. NPDC047000 TaxID=3155474 RepID=UPI00340BAF6F